MASASYQSKAFLPSAKAREEMRQTQDYRPSQDETLTKKLSGEKTWFNNLDEKTEFSLKTITEGIMSGDRYMNAKNIDNEAKQNVKKYLERKMNPDPENITNPLTDAELNLVFSKVIPNRIRKYPIHSPETTATGAKLAFENAAKKPSNVGGRRRKRKTIRKKRITKRTRRR
jgi:hypothetical protein